MPATMPEIWKRIGAGDKETAWNTVYAFGALPQNAKVTGGDPLFPRINIQQELEYMAAI